MSLNLLSIALTLPDTPIIIDHSWSHLWHQHSVATNHGILYSSYYTGFHATNHTLTTVHHALLSRYNGAGGLAVMAYHSVRVSKCSALTVHFL